MIMDIKRYKTMKIFSIKSILIISTLIMMLPACQEVDPLVEELEFDRVFTPYEFEVRIRNRTTAEFLWAQRENAEKYVLEIHQDSLQFENLVYTAEIGPDAQPYQVLLDGETQYSARLKATSSATGDSKWQTLTFQTEFENIFESMGDNDIEATSATLRWPAGSDVTHLLVLPDNTERPITDDEKAAGAATITGLTGETTYTVRIFRGEKQRGEVSFTTLIDIGNATPVYPEDDLSLVIEAASDGDVLALFPGVYEVFTGIITVNKSLSIRGVYPNDKPVVFVKFDLTAPVSNFEAINLEMVGTHPNMLEPLPQAFNFVDGTYNVNSVKIDGCIIRDFGRALIYGGGSVIIKLESLTINNCVMQNIVNDGGDFIDFRGGHVVNLEITNSTFNNVAASPRDFIRLDDSSGSFPGSKSTVLIDRCTFYNVSNSRRILYVRFIENEITVSNTIFAGADATYSAYYSNQTKTAAPNFIKNNYWNASSFISGEITNGVFDTSGTHTTVNPGFTNPENGDFTLSNDDLIFGGIGDPRWIP
jgi:hypothetical protein